MDYEKKYCKLQHYFNIDNLDSKMLSQCYRIVLGIQIYAYSSMLLYCLFGVLLNCYVSILYIKKNIHIWVGAVVVVDSILCLNVICYKCYVPIIYYDVYVLKYV